MDSSFSEPPPDWPQNNSQPGEWVLVARIVRPQGRHGEVLADLLTDFPERFSERKRLFLLAAKSAPRPLTLESHWLHQDRIVFKFAGFDSINDAETLRGIELAIPRTERAPLEDGAVYISDLIGCILVDSRTGEEIGKISNIDRQASSAPLLVIGTAGTAEVLVPFVRVFRPKIDLDARRIEMQLPEGLVDLNVPGSKTEGKVRS